jgi:serine/threonine-protein kinase RsbW
MTKDSSMRDNIDEIPWGGVGIKIIGKIADELSYIRTSDSRNSLFIVKYYHKPGLVQPQHRTQARFFKRALDVLNSFSFWFQKPGQFDRSSNQHLQKISLQLNTDIILLLLLKLCRRLNS